MDDDDDGDDGENDDDGHIDVLDVLFDQNHMGWVNKCPLKLLFKDDHLDMLEEEIHRQKKASDPDLSL